MARPIKPGQGRTPSRIVEGVRRSLERDRKPAKRRGTRSRPGRRLAHGCAFTREVQAAILGHVQAGDPRKYAAARVGIGERTLQRWVEKGRDNLADVDEAEGEIDDYGRFVQLLIQAEAYARGDVLEGIVAAAKDDWRAGAWYLERVDSRQFGRSQKVEGIVRDDDGEEVSAGDMLLEKLALMESRESRYAAGKGPDDSDG